MCALPVKLSWLFIGSEPVLPKAARAWARAARDAGRSIIYIYISRALARIDEASSNVARWSYSYRCLHLSFVWFCF